LWDEAIAGTSLALPRSAMFPLPILPAQAAVPGAGLDATSTGSSNRISEAFAALLMLLTPTPGSDAKILDAAEAPKQESTPEKGAQPEIAGSDLAMIAALLANVTTQQQVPESGPVEVPIVENSPALPPVPSRLQPILSFATGASPDQLGDEATPRLIAENLSSLPDHEQPILAQHLFDGVEDESSGRAARVSADAPALSTGDSKFSVFVSPAGEAAKIPPAIRELFEKSGAAAKKTVEGQEAVALAPVHETGGADSAPRGLAIADAQIDKHVDGTSLLPGDRSGFFSHDNNRGGGNESHGGGTPNQQPFVHGVTFQPVEAERAPAPAQNHFWSATIERLATEISAQARSERQEVSMRLEPPELGHVKIELALDGDRLQARVTTEFAEAGALIQSHVQELRQALQAHQLDLVSVQVDLGGSSGFSSNPQQGAESQKKGFSDFGGILPVGDAETGEAPRVPSVDRGGVSVWA
jgi:hypothetical protein